jgi:hypothetical protein
VSRRTLTITGAAAVAGLALGFGLSSAHASGKKPSPRPQRGTIWAAVSSDGTLARHSRDIVQVLHVATGQYRVFAKGDIRNCAYEATAGSVGLNAPPRTYADVAQGFFDPRAVFVETYDSTGTGTRVDSDFYLAILC